jgi:excisionase family DNA binding protein
VAGTGDYYTTSEAARILRRSPQRIRALASEGKLPGDRDHGEWRIPAWAVHERLEHTRAAPGGDERPLEDAERPLEDAEKRAAELAAEVRDLSYRLGIAEGRLQLTEVAESTLRESLNRERQRADAAELEAKRLRDELEEARQPWWRKVFR